MREINNRKKNIFRAVAVLFLFAVFIVIGYFLINTIKKSKELELPVAYDINSSVSTSSFGTNALITDSFASNICVGEDGINLDGVDISDTQHAGLFSVEDKSILYSKNVYERAYPASVTKIMTAILALKYGNMDDMVTITWRMVDLESGAQVCGFRVGDQVSMDELLHGLLIHSGNDAALAIAEHVGGSISEFVKMMNDEALALGATGTHFVNPNGLHDDNHYTTVYDLYLMLNEAMNYQEFVDIIQLGVYDINYLTPDSAVSDEDTDETDTTKDESSDTTADGSSSTDDTQKDVPMKAAVIHVDNTDKYLISEEKAPKDVTVVGGKTGTTDQAKNCLALISQNAYGKPYISIVLGAESKTVLYEQMNQLLSQINS